MLGGRDREKQKQISIFIHFLVKKYFTQSLTLPHSHQYAKSNQENIVKNVSGESYLEQHGMQGPRSTPIASLGQW